jgi:16S rRNA (uracil1498-N3)-methyltransferase
MNTQPYQAKTRLFLNDPLTGDVHIALGIDESHYLRNVMRKKAGDRLYLFNGRDGEWLAEIIDIRKKVVLVRVIEQSLRQSSEPDLWLAFAPVKKAATQFIAQKATELGVAALYPVMTRFTSTERVKITRLEANAREAAEQCGRLNVPKVAAVQKLAAFIENLPQDRRIMFCDEELSGRPAAAALSAALALSADGGEKACPWVILTGPEGGFSDDERQMIRARGNVLSVSLGPRILRADTAALAAITLWQSILGDWSGPN